MVTINIVYLFVWYAEFMKKINPDGNITKCIVFWFLFFSIFFGDYVEGLLKLKLPLFHAGPWYITLDN